MGMTKTQKLVRHVKGNSAKFLREGHSRKATANVLKAVRARHRKYGFNTRGKSSGHSGY